MSALEDTDEFLPPSAAGGAAPAGAVAPACVEVAGRSDQGLVRLNNEDHFLIARFRRSLDVLQTNLPERRLPSLAEEGGYAMVVADGLGGGNAGEVASSLAIATFLRLAQQVPDWILRVDQQVLIDEVVRRTAERYEQVNLALGDEARRDPSLSRFATTMTLALSLGKDLIVAHVGDSRVYRLRQGTLQRLTRDHTVAQARADIGLLTQEEVARHPMRHVLLRVVGDQEGLADPDVHRHFLKDGDSLLLCTDGLTGMVAEEHIAELLAGAESADAACRQLVEAALAAGGRDNVTVIVARYRFGPRM